MALSEHKISAKNLEVCQNIQYVCHNCTKLKFAYDDLINTTTYISRELDHKTKLNDYDYEPTISCDQFQQQNDYGVKQAHPTERSLSIIVSICNIIQQNISKVETQIPDITNIPEGIIHLCGSPNTTKNRRNKDVADNKELIQKRKNMKMCAMLSRY